MYGKVIILFALTGYVLIAAQGSSSDTNTTTGTNNGTETNNNTTSNNSNTTSNNKNTTTTTTTTQLPPTTSRHPKPPRHPPHGRPGLPLNRPSPGPRIPVVSDFVDVFNNVVNSVFNPPNRREPRGGRPRRAVNVQASFNSSIIPSLPGFPGVPNIFNFPIPNVDNMIPDIPALSDLSNLEIPEIPNLPELPRIPGLQNAVDEARVRVANEISPGEDLTTGIENAIQNVLGSPNPTEAARGLISTILKAYLAVARHCPLLIVGGYVLREGLFLTSSILAIFADITGQIQDRI